MKKIYFNIQSKGGVGKSMLTYLIALANENNDNTYFVDLDSSVQSSLQQLKFLQGKTPPRFAVMNLLDERDKIDRQLLFENLNEFALKEGYDTFYLDFGAPESDQLPSLFSTDYSITEFKQIEIELGCQFIFNIVVAGGGAYQACTHYMQKIVDLIDGHFEVNIYINQSTFASHLYLIDELQQFATLKQHTVKSVKQFGDFDVATCTHQSILRIIEEGKGMSAYQFIKKIKIRKELAKL